MLQMITIDITFIMGYYYNSLSLYTIFFFSIGNLDLGMHEKKMCFFKINVRLYLKAYTFLLLSYCTIQYPQEFQSNH